jgi:hypothetical protein
MKTRNGFVSNSSSSSFIVAIDITKNKPCECCGRKDIDIIDAIRHSYNEDDNRVNADGYEQVLKYHDNHSYLSQEEKDEYAAKLKPYNNPKWQVACITISDHDQTLDTIIDNMVKSKTLVVIDRR